MPKDRNLLIVIVDGEHARFVRPSADNALHTQQGIDSPVAHERSADLGCDRPGASFHSDSTAHHALQPRHDPHVLEKAAFAERIADQLNAAAIQGAFEELVLVAPAHTMNAIDAALEPAGRACVTGRLGSTDKVGPADC